MADINLKFEAFVVLPNAISKDNFFNSGDTITIDYSIINQTNSPPEGGTFVEFYLSTDDLIGTRDDFFLEWAYIPPDFFKNSTIFTHLITLPTNTSFFDNNGPGEYFVGAFIDVEPFFDRETFIDDNFTDVAQAEVIDIQIINNLPTDDTTPLTLDGTTAQIAYVAYYGRPADVDGLNFWNQVLSENGVSYSPMLGDPLIGNERNIYNQIVNQFGNSDEANRLFGGLSVREQVNLVYHLAFDRFAEPGGLDFWVPRVEDGSISLTAFALEVALGARNQDIITLRNKIESADLFSDSFARQLGAKEAYVGSGAEGFGRHWLDVFGSSISVQSQVDSALAELALI